VCEFANEAHFACKQSEDGSGHRVWKPFGCREVRLTMSEHDAFKLSFVRIKKTSFAGDSDDEDESE
jgi:hypothetical protein